MSYSVIMTDSAEEDLSLIINYIADDSGSKDIANDYYEKLYKAIFSLKDFPERGIIPRYTVLKNQGFRVLLMESHLIFYRVYPQEKSVIIFRIMHAKRDYKNLI